MPGNQHGVKTADAIGGIHHEPQAIFRDPENDNACGYARLYFPAPLRHPDDGEMEKDGDKRKYPGVIAGHGATTPEQIKQPMVFYAPGWQTTAPAIRTFDLNFHLRKKYSQHKDP
jgi:hypothetical protein